MRYLVVGDYHATQGELADCRRLAAFIVETAKAENAQVLLLGDQYHHHGVVHLEVMAFWRDFMAQCQAAGVPVTALVGNHDMPGTDGVRISSMMAHAHDCEVVELPLLRNGILFLPYQSTATDFLSMCQTYQAATVYCHQTFNGSTYENGFYAQDGVDPNLVPQDNVISGHIHAPQSFGKVWYVGAPRWRIETDANTDRAIWLVVHDQQGRIVERKSFDTGVVCRQIKHRIDTEAAPLTEALDPQHEWRIDVHGTSDYIERRRVELASPGIKIRSFKTAMTQPKIRESQGIVSAFRTFLEGFKPQHGTSAENLEQLAKERINVH